MSDLGPTIGVRETRKLEAVHRILALELASATKFEDGIVCCDNPIDDVMRTDAAMTHDAIVAKGSYYTIPFQAMVPRKIENLLFAGRLVCADPSAFASVRGMPQCMAMGEAVGVAATIAQAKNLIVQALDPAGLIPVQPRIGVPGSFDKFSTGLPRERQLWALQKKQPKKSTCDVVACRHHRPSKSPLPVAEDRLPSRR